MTVVIKGMHFEKNDLVMQSECIKVISVMVWESATIPIIGRGVQKHFKPTPTSIFNGMSLIPQNLGNAISKTLYHTKVCYLLYLSFETILDCSI